MRWPPRGSASRRATAPDERVAESTLGERSRGPSFAASWRMPKNSRNSLERSTRAFQETVNRAGPAAAASYTLIGAVLLLGGLGYAVDYWRDTSPWFLMAGLLLGMVVGFYELVKTTWPR
jgi:F0F1-type ATP synthase assembly protein I